MWQAVTGGGGGPLSLGKGRKGHREAGPGFVGANGDYFTKVSKHQPALRDRDGDRDRDTRDSHGMLSSAGRVDHSTSS